MPDKSRMCLMILTISISQQRNSIRYECLFHFLPDLNNQGSSISARPSSLSFRAWVADHAASVECGASSDAACVASDRSVQEQCSVRNAARSVSSSRMCKWTTHCPAAAKRSMPRHLQLQQEGGGISVGTSAPTKCRTMHLVHHETCSCPIFCRWRRQLSCQSVSTTRVRRKHVDSGPLGNLFRRERERVRKSLRRRIAAEHWARMECRQGRQIDNMARFTLQFRKD